MQVASGGNAQLRDCRTERQLNGHVKWNLEKGVPDIGGLGWRTRAGHLLKNQAYYAVQSNTNLWDNPTHAGPKTWQEYHGPKLRTDAPLMERLDRFGSEQREWEGQKTFVNTTRVQTLDRFYQQRTVNEAKEKASQWAPHRRAKREVHDSLDNFQAELDSMPMKELKKVLTPCVLQRDRDAIRSITKRVQMEETWKMQWKNLERERRDEIRSDFELRRAYNAALMEYAGQKAPPRSDPSLHCAASLTKRTQELSEHQNEKPPNQVTDLTDFRGLVHVDHKHALEARFPGKGHDFASTFNEHATDSSRAQWPPPSPPRTPTGMKRDQSLQEASVTAWSLPVSEKRLDNVAARRDVGLLSVHATSQFQATSPPPAPQQNEKMLEDSMQASMQKSAELSGGPNIHGGMGAPGASLIDVAPAVHTMVYPVAVPAVEPNMQLVGWKPKRRSTPVQGTRAGAGKGKWPPCGSRFLNVTVFSAAGLPKADRSGHSDPYTMCQVVGRPRSRVVTQVIDETEEPVWNEELCVEGWTPGSKLQLTVLDKDTIGADDKLATITLESSKFFPDGFEGKLALENVWAPNGQRIDNDRIRENQACQPTLTVKITVLADTAPAGSGVDVASGQNGIARLAMPGTEPNLAVVCQAMDDFDASMKAAPRLGNFWRSSSRRGQQHTATAEGVMQTVPQQQPGSSLRHDDGDSD